MSIKQWFLGIASFVPGVNKYCCRGTGGTTSSRYCYSVWLRHLVMAHKSGLNSCPKIVAELGPGDSIGIGLCALISGCDKYIALDIVQHTNVLRNLAIFDELLVLFRDRVGIPNGDEFPNVSPVLESYEFPNEILDESRMRDALKPERIEKIRESIINVNNDGSLITYKAPWNDEFIMEKESVDMVYSQAVLEHVDDLQNAYESMYKWLKPAGYMSHQVDFKCHNTAQEWNGHWKYSDFSWKLLRGRRCYLINREPYSVHVVQMKQAGFKTVCNIMKRLDSNITIKDLPSRSKVSTDDDLSISGAFIQSVKRK